MTIGRGSLEPQRGSSTPMSGGDRVLLLMAVLVLLAAGAMVIGNLLPEQAAVTTTTPRAVPSVAASKTPTPTPSVPRQMAVVPGEASPSETFYPNPQGWLRVGQKLSVRSDPDPADPTVVGTITAGSTVLVQGFDEIHSSPVPGWLYVADPEPRGWVALDVANGSAGTWYPLQRDEQTEWVDSITAGADRLLATGAAWDATINVAWMATSTDGTNWQRVDAGGSDLWLLGAAHGPAGWLAIGEPLSGGWWGGGQLQLEQSPNGTDWTVLGRLEGTSGDWWPQRLVGFDGGYLLQLQGGYRGSQVWYSSDGLSWTEASLRDSGSWNDLQLVDTPFGFYGLDADEEATSANRLAVYSGDGRTWVPVDGGPEGPDARVGAAGTGLVGMDNDPQSGLARVWIGDVYLGQVSWRQISIPEFSGRSVAWLGSGEGRAVAFLWDPDTAELTAWETRDRRHWAQLDLPQDAFPSPPGASLVRDTQLILSGQHVSLGRRQDVLWTLDETGWRPQELPSVAPEIADQPTECPAAPRDALDFLQIDPGFASYCFGDSALTFTAFIVPCDDCGWDAETGLEPAWLADPGLRRIFVAPVETDLTIWQDMIPGPELEWDPAWDRSWVELTGHYNDPASSECRSVWADATWWESGQALREDCARRFVITRVTPVAGP